MGGSTTAPTYAQLKQLLDDPKCYVGNGMKQAKTLLDTLRSRLEKLASEARAAAEQAVTSKVQKLTAIDGFDKLSDQQKQQIDSIVDEPGRMAVLRMRTSGSSPGL